MSFDPVGSGRTFIACMQLFGFWRFRDKKIQFINVVYYFVLHSLITVPFILSLCVKFFRRTKNDNFAEIFFIGLSEGDLIVKVVNCLVIGKHTLTFSEMCEDEMLVLKTDRERKLFRKSHRILGFLHKLYVWMSVFYISMTFIMPFFAAHWKLPVYGWFPFDWQKWENYWYAWIFQFLGAIVTGFGNVTLDLFIPFTIMQCALYYKVIGWRFEMIGEARNAGEVDDLKAVKDFIEIIEMRKFVDRMTSECERIVSIPIFIQAILSALILCFTGYQLQSMSILETPIEFFQMIDYAGVMSLQIYLPCYYGNEITLNTDYLTNAIYNSNWPDLSVRTQKLLITYMEYVKKPVIIKAANFFEVGLPIFSKVINYAYSLYALLLNMN